MIAEETTAVGPDADAPLDLDAIRRQFPILNQRVHGRPLVYLDNAATSQKPRQVIQALVDYYEGYNANVHRAVHTLGELATDQYEGARAKVARFIGASDPAAVIFTRNATEAINLVALSWARRSLREGDEIVLSEAEHHSNLVPWQMVAEHTGARLRFIPITPSGELDMEQAERIIGGRTRLVTTWHMSNVLGSVTPVRRLADLAHAHGALMLVDGAQSVPHMPVSVADLDCDFLAFSGHKMLGPTGIGALWVRPEVLGQMEPVLGGGDMIRQVWLERATWNDLPWRFEAGTPNIADAIALGVAVDYLTSIGMSRIHRHEQSLVAYALKALGEVPGIVIYGPRNPSARGGVISFNLGDIHPHDLGTILDHEGVAIRAGHHCCQPLMRRLGVAATARASFYLYNAPYEVDALVRGLYRAMEVFGNGRC